MALVIAAAERAGRSVVISAPGPARWMVDSIVGYRMPPMSGVHRGMPGPYLTLVFSLAGALPIDIPLGGSSAGSRAWSGEFLIPLGGLHSRAVLLPPKGPQVGIQLAVNPLASPRLFGMPAGELLGQVIEFDQISAGERFPDRLTDASGPAHATAQVRDWLDRCAVTDATDPKPELFRAWRLIVGSQGRRRITDVAADVGWSRRHLTAQLRAETGYGAEDLARLARFQHARRMIVTGHGSLAEVAAASGYADQSQLNAEWREFAGCTPGQWIAAEVPALSRPVGGRPAPAGGPQDRAGVAGRDRAERAGGRTGGR